jgi:choline dehydrogenase-like flavoprotein
MPDRSGGSGVVDNLIVGSGLAAIAAAMALRERGAPFEVLDIGYDLDPATEQAAARLSGQPPEAWNGQDRARLFPPPRTSTKGVQRRLLFGSDFPYRVPDLFSVTMENCTTELSHGLGGFGNVWGAAMLPYSVQALRGWPVAKDELDRSYRNVLKYVPISAEHDGLGRSFPLYTERATALRRSGQVEALLGAFERRSARMARDGVEFGRARVAVDSGGGDAGCRYCGMCLDGCVYGSIFSPRAPWKRLEAAGTAVHRRGYALEFKEHDDHVVVTTVGVDDGAVREWRARRVFLAAGHFATARMIARSLGRFDETIRVQDSQYFFFPLLSYRAIREEVKFALAEMFLEILNKDVTDDYLHFQLYGMNGIFRQTLRAMIPPPIPLGPIASRFYMVQGYLGAADSGHLEMEVKAAGAGRDQVVIRGVENPRALPVARKAQALLRRNLIGFGVIPPVYLQLVPPGRSFHTGGSFPMGGRHPVFASDTLGRPAGLKRVHIADSANFPTVASSTIGFTIMANADRIARACAALPG